METPTLPRVAVTPETLKALRENVQAAADTMLRATGFASLVGTQGYGVTLKERAKFWAVDIGSSGAWMVRKSDGAIFGIKAYGTPHYGRAIGYLGEVSGTTIVGLRWEFAGPKSPFRKDITK